MRFRSNSNKLDKAIEAAPNEIKPEPDNSYKLKALIEKETDDFIALYMCFSFVELLTGKYFIDEYKSIDELPLPAVTAVKEIFNESNIRNVIFDCFMTSIDNLDEARSSIDDSQKTHIGEILKMGGTKFIMAYNLPGGVNEFVLNKITPEEWYRALVDDIYDDSSFNKAVMRVMKQL